MIGKSVRNRAWPYAYRAPWFRKYTNGMYFSSEILSNCQGGHHHHHRHRSFSWVPTCHMLDLVTRSDCITINEWIITYWSSDCGELPCFIGLPCPHQWLEEHRLDRVDHRLPQAPNFEQAWKSWSCRIRYFKMEFPAFLVVLKSPEGSRSMLCGLIASVTKRIRSNLARVVLAWRGDKTVSTYMFWALTGSTEQFLEDWTCQRSDEHIDIAVEKMLSHKRHPRTMVRPRWAGKLAQSLAVRLLSPYKLQVAKH